MLNDCLAMCNTVKVAQNSQNRRWPTSTKDIMPHGGKVTTQAFLRWAHYAEDMAFAAFANPEAGEIFVSTGWRMCRDATEACVMKSYTFLMLGTTMNMTIGFLRRLNSASAPRRETKMVQLLSLILEVRDAPSVFWDPELVDQFKSFDWTIFSALARKILVDHPNCSHRSGNCIGTSFLISGPLRTRCMQLTECSLPNGAAPVATRRMPPIHRVHRHRVQTLRCLSGGRLLRQGMSTRAWKSGPHAHKHICAKIKTLIAKGGGLDDRDAFVENCRKANVSADEALEVAKWEFNRG
ncbi:hypothetical protein B0H13DRAFT_2383139 [Mycena leptocephala]|nr:hypothetical protein B0H13DRAFT_2383139 [Mycena leptocephala]